MLFRSSGPGGRPAELRVRALRPSRTGVARGDSWPARHEAGLSWSAKCLARISAAATPGLKRFSASFRLPAVSMKCSPLTAWRTGFNALPLGGNGFEEGTEEGDEGSPQRGDGWDTACVLEVSFGDGATTTPLAPGARPSAPSIRRVVMGRKKASAACRSSR